MAPFAGAVDQNKRIFDTPRIYSWSAEFEFELVIGEDEFELGG